MCLPKRSMDDVMGLSVGSLAEDEACSWVKSTVRRWRDDHAGVLELVRHLGCLPLAIGLASAHAGVHGTARPGEFLAALERVAPPPPPQLEVGAKVELHSLNATGHNGKHGELLEYDAEAQVFAFWDTGNCLILSHAALWKAGDADGADASRERGREGGGEGGREGERCSWVCAEVQDHFLAHFFVPP